jgi:hypothetical protein
VKWWSTGLIERTYLVDLHMGTNGMTNDATITRNNIHNTGREAGLVYECAHAKSGEGGEFGGLENDTIACGKRGSNLPYKHHD